MAEEFQKTPKKADRWFVLAIVFALLYGATYSLFAIFNWLFFFASAYSFFMSYYLLPVQPRIFQQQRRQPNYGNPRQPNAGAPPTTPIQKATRITFGIVGAGFAFFMILVVYFMINQDPTPGQQTETTYQDVSEETSDPTATQFVDKGDTFFNNKEYDSAAANYQKALDIDPGSMLAIYGQGIVLWETGRKEDAMAKFRQSYEGGNRFWWLSYILADGYEKDGNPSMAVGLYKESLGLDSACTDCYNRLAELEPENRDKYLLLARKHPSN